MKLYVCLVVLAALGFSSCESEENRMNLVFEPKENPVVQVEWTESPDDTMLVVGAYFYMADAAIFTVCNTGERLPVLSEEANRDAERIFWKPNRGMNQPRCT